VGSRSKIILAYIAGFLDGDGSLMLQIKRRNDGGSGRRFMATICFYQDSRHAAPLVWIREMLGIGYISKRNDGVTELRINGYESVKRVLQSLLPFIRFKRNQALALLKACAVLENRKRSDKELKQVVACITIIQEENYASRRKKTKEDLLKILDLTP
jgi:hypothetical protein